MLATLAPGRGAGALSCPAVDGTRVGVDVGGTFTDAVLAAGDRLVVVKLLSTPENYGQAIVDGTQAAARDAALEPVGQA
jgi:N-methylhydantoinase A